MFFKKKIEQVAKIQPARISTINLEKHLPNGWILTNTKWAYTLRIAVGHYGLLEIIRESRRCDTIPKWETDIDDETKLAINLTIANSVKKVEKAYEDQMSLLKKYVMKECSNDNRNT
jgi:hypothetical protein